MFHNKAFRDRYCRNFLILKTDGFTTHGTGKMHMFGMVYAILLQAAAIVNGVEQTLLYTEGQCAEQGATVCLGQRTLNIGQRKDEIKIRDGSPNKNTHGRGTNALFL